MRYRHLGGTGVRVSEISLGTGGQFGGRVDRDAVRRIVAAALDAGINYVDTANIYGDGHSEEYLGPALEGHPPRDRARLEGNAANRPRPERVGRVALQPDERARGEPPATANRPPRPVPGPPLRRDDADGRDDAHARRHGPVRQGPLRRRVAVPGVAGLPLQRPGRALRLGALRDDPGPLPPAGARVRARDGPVLPGDRRRDTRVLPAGRWAAGRTLPARTALPRGQPRRRLRPDPPLPIRQRSSGSPTAARCASPRARWSFSCGPSAGATPVAVRSRSSRGRPTSTSAPARRAARSR